MSATARKLTARDLAAEFNVSKQTITDHARRLGLGINFGGRAGYRFNQADIDALNDALATPAIEL